MSSDFWSANTIATELQIGTWRVAYAINKAGIEPDVVVSAGSFYGPKGRAAIIAEIESIRAGVEARRKAVPA